MVGKTEAANCPYKLSTKDRCTVVTTGNPEFLHGQYSEITYMVISTLPRSFINLSLQKASK